MKYVYKWQCKRTKASVHGLKSSIERAPKGAGTFEQVPGSQADSPRRSSTAGQ